MLGARVASAVVLIPIVLLALWFSVETTALLAGIGAIIGTYEFYNMATHAPAHYRLLYLPGFILAAALCYAAWSPYAHSLILMVIAIILFMAIILVALGVRDLLDPKPADAKYTFGWNWTLSVFAPVYASLPLALLVLIRKDQAPLSFSGWVLLAMVGTWGTDTAAYFTGRFFGKHKLAPVISPKKTIEGAVGGVVLGVIAVVLIGKLTLGLHLYFLVLLGLVVSIASILGDLFESWVKRRFDTKDAGNLIPGHGGLLDRIDSFLVVSVLVYLSYKIYFIH
jgi:phosphatidate cytidylyltransferase